MKTAAIAVLLLAAAASAGAQQRHHVNQRPSGPSRPSRPVAPASPVVPPGVVIPQTPLIPAPVATPAASTPFDARPGTYAPHYADRIGRRGNGYGSPYVSGAVGIGDYVPAAADSAAPVPDQRAEAPSPVAPPAQPLPEPPRVAVAHGPDTFHVIPGCYAGNRPPNPSRLPKGCDASKLQTVAVR